MISQERNICKAYIIINIMIFVLMHAAACSTLRYVPTTQKEGTFGYPLFAWWNGR